MPLIVDWDLVLLIAGCFFVLSIVYGLLSFSLLVMWLLSK